MDLSYLLTGISLLAFTIAEDVIRPSDTCTGPVASLTIEKIAGKTGNKLDVCCIETDLVSAAPTFLLGITGSDGILRQIASIIKTLGCVEFNIDIISLAAPDDDIKIAMQLLDASECPTAGGAVQIKYPTLPGVTEFFGTDPANNDEILLLQGNMNGFSSSDLVSIQHFSNSDDTINYYVGKLPQTVELCILLNTINFCDVPLSLAAVPLETGPSVASSVLSYGYTIPAVVSANVKIETSSSITTDGSDFLDILYMSDPAGEEVVCRGPLTGSCDILWSNPPSNTATFRLIGLLGDIPKETEIHAIPDRELLIGEISQGIVEARWLILEDVEKTYHLSLNTVAPPSNDDQELNVDCSQVSLTNCFGYFSGLPANTYTITVQTTRVSDPEYDKVKQIQSSAIVTTIKVFKELHIQDVHISGHLGHKAVLLGVCFNHATYDVDQIFSHYEFVLINEKGQWLKHYLMITETDGDLCFSPYTINRMAFNISLGTTLVVTQRAENGFNVLASGRTHVNFGTIL